MSPVHEHPQQGPLVCWLLHCKCPAIATGATGCDAGVLYYALLVLAICINSNPRTPSPGTQTTLSARHSFHLISLIQTRIIPVLLFFFLRDGHFRCLSPLVPTGVRPSGEWKYSARYRILGHERPGVVFPDRALCYSISISIYTCISIYLYMSMSIYMLTCIDR